MQIGCYASFVFDSKALQSEISRIASAYARRDDGTRYTPADPAHMLAVQERENRLLAMLAHRGYGSLESSRILEIGCGTGYWLRRFVDWGARPEHIFGV